jgi:HK97 family phage major capsid protein
MMTKRQFEQRIEQKSAEARAIADEADATNGGVLTDAQQEAFDNLMTAIEGLKTAMTNRMALDDIDRRMAGIALGQGGPTTGDGRLDKEASRVTLLDVVRAMLPHEQRSELSREQIAGADRARTVSDELGRRSGRPARGCYFHAGVNAAGEKRVLSSLGGSTGSELIQTTLAPTVEDRLRQKNLVRKMGATILSGMVGNFAVPRLDTSAVATWIPDAGALSATDQVFDQILFTPRHCGAITTISRNLLLQPSYDATALVENDLARQLAIALDTAALVGTGVNDPLGLLTSGSGITIVSGGTNGSAPTWANVIALIKSIDQSNALEGDSLGFITNAKVVAAMRTTSKLSADTIGNFIINDDPNDLAGYTLGSTQNMPSTFTKGTGTALSGIIFGAWDMLCIAFWSELDILLNPYQPADYLAGNLSIRAMMTASINTRHPLAFSALTDVIAP